MYFFNIILIKEIINGGNNVLSLILGILITLIIIILVDRLFFIKNLNCLKC